MADRPTYPPTYLPIPRIKKSMKALLLEIKKVANKPFSTTVKEKYSHES